MAGLHALQQILSDHTELKHSKAYYDMHAPCDLASSQ